MMFPASCRQTLTAFLLSVSAHLSRKRPADTLLEFITHSSSIIIVFLNELANAMAVSPGSSTEESVQNYLKLQPESNLAHVIDEKHQKKKLDLVAEDILESFLEHKSYNCEPVRVFLQEILAKVILEMTIVSCSRAEFINEWIVYLLEDAPVLEPSTEGDSHISTGQAGNVDSVGGDSKEPLETDSKKAKAQTRHQRVVSKAQEAMDEAMREAARLTQMIQEDDARRQGGESESQQASVQDSPPKRLPSSVLEGAAISTSSTFTDDASEITPGLHTPTSSQSDSQRQGESPAHPEVESKPPSSEETRPSSSFTSFDQIMPRDTALMEEAERKKKEPQPLTLYKANIVIFDDSDPSDRSAVRNKPLTEYLIQIEPATSQYPGWMIVRRFPDFEALHQVLGRLSKITDARTFAEAHANLPHWKGLTKATLREELERYLTDAVQHRSLAECEGMKRFLEKEVALPKTPAKQGGFPGRGAFENVGKGMIDVLGQAPKGISGGGKAIMGGVSGVLGSNKTPKKGTVSPALSRSNTSASSLNQPRVDSTISLSPLPRQSQDSLHTSSPIVDTQPAPVLQMERRPSSRTETEAESKPRPTAVSSAWEATPVLGGDQILHLPPPPSDIPDDYDANSKPSSTHQPKLVPEEIQPRVSVSTTSSSIDLLRSVTNPATSTTPAPSKPSSVKTKPSKPPLTERETQVTLELCLAAITELYKLSSAWSVRLAFLNAAKTILLRPGNTQLDSIRQLLQDTLLDANTSDAGLATHIRKLRLNTLPTESELELWPKERTPEEKESLRRNARKLLVERGMPQALNSVMGQAASGEALGRVFDALQDKVVAKGLVFGLLLQAIRAVTQ
jgi:hypothetical protein